MNLPQSIPPQQEVWTLKLNDLAGQKALYLRFATLISRNGFRQSAEVWALYTEKAQGREILKTAVRQTTEVGRLLKKSEFSVESGSSAMNLEGSKGDIRSSGHTLSWDLSFRPEHAARFRLAPSSLLKAGILTNCREAWNEDLRISGTLQVDGQTIEWKEARGMQSHFAGTRSSHSWTWGHCNSFVDDKGAPSNFVFEGMTFYPRLIGPIPGPRISSFYFFYKGKEYRLNNLWDAIRIRSRRKGLSWTFRCDRGNVSFRGKMKADFRDFAGLTYEDTNGSLLFCSNSQLAQLEIHVYRGGKLETSVYGNGTAGYEVATRQRNPYVAHLL